MCTGSTCTRFSLGDTELCVRSKRGGHSSSEGKKKSMSEVVRSMSKSESEVEKSISMLLTVMYPLFILFLEIEKSACFLENDTGTKFIGTGTKSELGKSITALVSEMVVNVVS